ncbi:MAG: baseplate J/gp47 family protein [Ectothiorhodospiraceae bacterium]|nr:baseplate J/gp47 family protein [Ectothiorhodospiraceae bacterium]
MNYTPEPYPVLVDQLLTALTGGETRETHRFFLVNDGFALTRPLAEVRADTVRVIGQSGERFTEFVPGRDWRLDGAGKVRFAAADTDPETPAENASWPDEGTDFHVSYYHTRSHLGPLTDRNVGSVTRTLAESFARELTVLEKQLELVYRSGFVETAEGRALDHVVALLGIERKGGEYAAGAVRFMRDTPAPADIVIPAGRRLSTTLNPPVRFVTTAARTLRRGQLSVDVPVRAEVRGADGVVPAGSIVHLDQPLLGVEGVSNDAPTVFGGSAETDEELRARAAGVVERIGRATPGALVNAIAAGSGLKENEIKLSEDLAGSPGLVRVFVAREPDPDLARLVQDAVVASRPAGVRVEHNLQGALRADDDGAISDEESSAGGETSVPPSAEDFRAPIRASVLVYPEDPRIGAAAEQTLRNTVRDTVAAYFDGLAIGDPVRYNRVLADLMGVDGVRDVDLDVWAASAALAAGRRNLRLDPGQRAVVLDPATDITVELAGAPVSFDLRLVVDLLPGKSLAEAQASARAKLEAFFATAPSTVDAAVLTTALVPDTAFSLAAGGLHWTVEYEQAGLLVEEVDEPVTVSSRERAVLRDVDVETAA